MFKRIHYNAPVILTYFLISGLVLLVGNITQGYSNFLLFSVYRSRLTDPLGYLRLFTHVLGHVNYVHFFNNFMMILLVGPHLEEKYGSIRILIMIVFTALVTGVVHIIFFTNTILLGASGVLFMLIVLSSYTNYQRGRIPVTLVCIIILFIGQEIVSAIYVEDSNISYITHIVGGICGVVLGLIYNNMKS